jgi:hypothetical protein
MKKQLLSIIFSLITATSIGQVITKIGPNEEISKYVKRSAKITASVSRPWNIDNVVPVFLPEKKFWKVVDSIKANTDNGYSLEDILTAYKNPDSVNTKSGFNFVSWNSSVTCPEKLNRNAKHYVYYTWEIDEFYCKRVRIIMIQDYCSPF